MTEEMTPRVLAELWAQHKSGDNSDDEDLGAFQKYMILHEELHPLWDRLAADPETSLVVDGENMMLHIAMDVSTERSIQRNEPSGIQGFFQTLVANDMHEGAAFHVIATAMQHEFLEAAGQGQDMDLNRFLARAAEYCKQALEQKPKEDA